MCYIRAVNNFQIMIANGGSMKCGGCCENVHLQIGQYHLKCHMFTIDMGGCDIVLSVEWLRTLDPITMDFKDLTMQFQQEGQQYKFQGIMEGSPKIISSHQMEKLLKKGHSGIISQLHSIQAVETPSPTMCIPTSNLYYPNTNMFLTLPKDFPLPTGTHDHSIPLVPGSLPPNVCPYHHPFSQKNEIEKIVQEFLEVGVIHPSTIPYSSPVVMVLKK
jgi:hypothetical protein